MKWFRASLRWILVTLGVVLLTSVTVDATLSPNGFSQSALGILASTAVPKTVCPEGMVELTTADSRLCVDMFESSPGENCPLGAVRSEIDTRKNLESTQCNPLAESGARPWTHLTFHQAFELCARAGKRLPSPDEWYLLAIGTPDSLSAPVCNTKSGSLRESDESSLCKNGNGIYDSIGNAWEWVDGEVDNGALDGRTLPESGYVAGVDRNGVAERTTSNPNDEFYRDYFWSENGGQFGLLRGGFYGSGDDAGLFSVQAKTSLSFSSDAIGFRCVDDIL